MEPARYYNRNLFLFASLTLLLVGAYQLLPEKRWEWLPQSDVEAYIYSDKIFGGISDVEWLDQQALAFTCNLKSLQDDALPFCGMRVHLTKPWLPAADLSDYERVEVDTDYEGHNKKLRFFMMEFVEGYSNPKNPIDDGHAKYLAAYVPSEETKSPFVIKMSEFLVADWWVNNEDVPREFSNASRKNIMTFGVDIAYPTALGEHKLKINKVTFVGTWVSAEHWYLGIVLVWVAFMMVGGIARYYYLRNYTVQLQEEKTRYQQLSMIDTLTGLLNRYGLMSYYENELAESREWPIAMVLLDIDFFKRINDNFGHNIGDIVLRRIGRILNEQKPLLAKVSRWGGEEFLVLLPNTDKDKACQFAEHLRIKVSELPNPEINDQAITISIGVGELAKEESFERSFKRVDDALYKAKGAGRNCFVSG